MPKISFVADPSSTASQAAIDMLRTRERKWRKTGSKRALVRYLVVVFDLYRDGSGRASCLQLSSAWRSWRASITGIAATLFVL